MSSFGGQEKLGSKKEIAQLAVHSILLANFQEKKVNSSCSTFSTFK